MRRWIAPSILAISALSCAKALGVADEPERVSAVVCNCHVDKIEFASDAACEQYVEERLSEAADEVVATWLDTWAERCTSCASMLECFRTPPLCKTRGCTEDWQCCSGGKCDADTGICSP